jgi:hypothetical protein
LLSGDKSRNGLGRSRQHSAGVNQDAVRIEENGVASLYELSVA